MFRFKKIPMMLIGVVLLIVCMAAPAGAVEVKSGDMVTVPEGKIQGPLVVSGKNIIINADVDGDVFAAGETVTVNGSINGDVLAAARNIIINGSVKGDVRCAAADADIKGEVGQSLTALVGKLRQFEGSRVNQDVLALAKEVSISGTVGRQVLGSAQTVYLNGPVGGDTRFWAVDALNVGPGSRIAGNLIYGSPSQGTISPEARIGGSTQWEQLEPVEKPRRQEGISWLGQLVWFAAGVTVWGVMYLVFPGIWFGLSRIILQKPLPALGWGVMTLLLAPLASLLLLITVIGIPLSLILAMVYGALIYAGKIIVGDAVGRYLAGRLGWENRIHEIFPFMIGYAGLILLGNIPVAGFFTSVVAICLAMGAVFLSIGHWRQKPPVTF